MGPQMSRKFYYKIVIYQSHYGHSSKLLLLVESRNAAAIDSGASKTDQELIEAKIRELNCWKEQNVYKEISDTDQSTISLKWVIKYGTRYGTSKNVFMV